MCSLPETGLSYDTTEASPRIYSYVSLASVLRVCRILFAALPQNFPDYPCTSKFVSTEKNIV